jgi:hypothetical protein
MPITSEPAPNPPIDGACRIRIAFGYQTKSPNIGFWSLVTGVPDGDDLVLLATDIMGHYHDTLLPNQVTSLFLNEVEVTYYSAGFPTSASAFDHLAGSMDGAASLQSSAMLLSWAIISSYRGGKPRTYLPGMDRTDEDSTFTWSDTRVAAVRSDAADFLTAVNGITTPNIDSVTLGCLHFFRAGTALDPPYFDPFIGVDAQKRICTQRRRLGPEIT